MIDSLKEWNAKGSDGVAAIVENRKRNIDYTLYLITFSLVKSALNPRCLILVKCWPKSRRGRIPLCLHRKLHSPRRDFGGLMRQDYLSRCRTREVANATSVHVKAAAERRIDLGDDYNAVSVEHSQMIAVNIRLAHAPSD